MKMPNPTRSVGMLTVAAAVCLASQVRADMLYLLEPGSTITAYYHGNPIGPTEPLTGMFSWHIYTGTTNMYGVDATSLTFQSVSFHLTLNTTVNNIASTIFGGTQTSYWNEIVDCPGLSVEPLEFGNSGLGSYEGPPESPTRLVYSQLYLAPIGGGPSLARIAFTAVQVPEPAELALTAAGLVTLAGWWRIRPSIKRIKSRWCGEQGAARNSRHAGKSTGS